VKGEHDCGSRGKEQAIGFGRLQLASDLQVRATFDAAPAQHRAQCSFGERWAAGDGNDVLLSTFTDWRCHADTTMITRVDQCPTKDQLVAWINDEVPHDNIQVLAQHTNSCIACAEEVARLRAAQVTSSGAQRRDFAWTRVVPCTDAEGLLSMLHRIQS
jgi:hypothetical protein